VPVLFLDLLDDLVTPSEDDPEEAIKTGKLFGEKPETMIKLPIITANQEGVSPFKLSAQVIAVGVWISLASPSLLPFCRDSCKPLLLGTPLFIIPTASIKLLVAMTVSMASLKWVWFCNTHQGWNLF
jgi:hypothetical protein